MATSSHILRIDTSALHEASSSRALADRIVERISGPDTTVTQRDLGDGISGISGPWLAANFTPADDRSEDQAAALALSDELIAELKAADTLVLSVPIYNFSIPSALKAWIDQIARAGVTFNYTPTGPVGLLEGKRAYISITSGGVEVGGPMDFASGYLKHVLGFVGITDVQIVASDQRNMDPEASAAKAEAAIQALAA